MQRLRLQSLGRNIEMKRYRVQITIGHWRIWGKSTVILQNSCRHRGQYDRIAEAIEGLCILPERIRLMESEPEYSM